MSLFGPRPGTWWISSESDPRWNVSGRVEAMLVSAGMLREAEEALRTKKAELGEPPSDLMYGCMKD